MECTITHIKKFIKHVSTHWLSLGQRLDRTLTQWDTLQSYFVSNFGLSNDVCDGNENDNTKLR